MDQVSPPVRVCDLSEAVVACVCTQYMRQNMASLCLVIFTDFVGDEPKLSPITQHKTDSQRNHEKYILATSSNAAVEGEIEM